jgi:hypothetical protein
MRLCFAIDVTFLSIEIATEYRIFLKVNNSAESAPSHPKHQSYSCDQFLLRGFCDGFYLAVVHL